jgi:diaminopimelate epimerase
LIETDARFPRRTNVQFMQVLDPTRLRIEIWERGAGYTLASGSSACAAAAVAYRLGLCDAQVTVSMPGGLLEVAIAPDWNVTLRGPVTKVWQGVLFQEAFDA